MKLFRYATRANPDQPRVGAVLDSEVIVCLSALGVQSLTELLEAPEGPAARVKSLPLSGAQALGEEFDFLAPSERQPIWAAGVTYLRSKTARMEESDFSASAYDRVYDAPRPEIFFKSAAEDAVATGSPVGIREDAQWNVPEPELALVFNSSGVLVGYTIGNDMSSRDIEGENLLYLPQAKTYYRSCGLGPYLTIGASETDARTWEIHLSIRRGEEEVFRGETSVSQIKRPFEELKDYLFQSQRFPNGAILLTGTGIVPPDSFTLNANDEIRISISGIGMLENSVQIV